MLGAAEVVVCDARDFSQSARVLFFKSGSLLQEGCEFLEVVSSCSPWLFLIDGVVGLPLRMRHSASGV